MSYIERGSPPLPKVFASVYIFTSVYIFSFENLENMINSCVLARYFAGETNANRRGSLEGNGIHQSTEFII